MEIWKKNKDRALEIVTYKVFYLLFESLKKQISYFKQK